LLLQGCFSASLRLELASGGQASAALEVRLPRATALPPALPAVVGPGARIRVYHRQGQVVVEQARVRNLKELCLRWVRVCVEKVDIGLIGSGKATYEVAVVLEPGEIKARWMRACRPVPLGPAPPVPSPEVMEAWRRGLGGQWVEVVVRVPGEVVGAWGQKVCTRVVGPVVKGQQVRWKIGLAELVGCRWTRPVVLRARFVGHFALGGGKGSYIRSRPWRSCLSKP